MKKVKTTMLVVLAALVLPMSLMSFRTTEIKSDFYKSKEEKAKTIRSGVAANSALTATVVVWTQVAVDYTAAAAEALTPDVVTILLLDQNSQAVHYKSLSADQIFEKTQQVKMAELDGN